MDLRKCESVFSEAITLWKTRNYSKALSCFSVVTEQAPDRGDLHRKIAELTGDIFPIKKITIGKNPVLSPKGKHLAFIAQEGNEWKMFVGNICGGNLKGLSNTTASNIQALFSPSGRHLVYTSGSDGLNEISTVDLKSWNKKCLGKMEGKIYNLVFSPDNKRIAFSCVGSNASTVRLIDISNGGSLELKTEAKWNYAPIFSPDSSKILYIARRSGKSKKKTSIILTAKGGNAQGNIVDTDIIYPPLYFFPEGKFLAFSSSDGIYYCTIDGKILKRLTHNKRGIDWRLSFSADGKYLLFISRQDRGDEVRLLCLTTMNMRSIYSSRVPLAWARFLPGSQKIICARWQSGLGYRLFLIDLDGKDSISIGSDTPCGFRNISWQRNVSFSPDSKKIICAYESVDDPKKPSQVCSVDLEPAAVEKTKLSVRLKELLTEERIMEKRAELTFKSAGSFLKGLTTQVSQNNLEKHIQILQDFGPRNSGSEACRKAGEYIYKQFTSYGLYAEYDNYEYPQDKNFDSRNIIATLPGETNPGIIYIVCAHYDSMEGSPGAWDNASGVAVVLETAKILSTCRFGATVKFICFSGEEMQNVGSKHLARRAKSENLDIRSVFNNDSIGYLGSDKIEIAIYYTSTLLRNLLHSAAAIYTGLLSYSSVGSGKSDGGSFTKDFGNIAAMIQDYPYLPNPHMHASGDVMQLLSLPKITEIAMLNISALATILSSPSPVQSIRVEKNKQNGDLYVSWQNNDEKDIAGYRIYYGCYPDIFEQKQEVGSANHYIFRNLSAEKSCIISIKAYNEKGHESWGAEEIAVKGYI